jgi:hypothetical protein
MNYGTGWIRKKKLTHKRKYFVMSAFCLIERLVMDYCVELKGFGVELKDPPSGYNEQFAW